MQDVPAAPALPGLFETFTFYVEITSVLDSDKSFGFCFGSKGSVTLAKNVELVELPSLGKEYSVSFGLFINKIPTVEWASVIRLNTGGDNDQMGSRNPLVQITNSKKLYVMSGISGNWNENKAVKENVEENKWYNIVITQKLVEGKVINKNFEFKSFNNFTVHV